MRKEKREEEIVQALMIEHESLKSITEDGPESFMSMEMAEIKDAEENNVEVSEEEHEQPLTTTTPPARQGTYISLRCIWRSKIPNLLKFQEVANY